MDSCHEMGSDSRHEIGFVPRDLIGFVPRDCIMPRIRLAQIVPLDQIRFVPPDGIVPQIGLDLCHEIGPDLCHEIGSCHGSDQRRSSQAIGLDLCHEIRSDQFYATRLHSCQEIRSCHGSGRIHAKRLDCATHWIGFVPQGGIGFMLVPQDLISFMPRARIVPRIGFVSCYRIMPRTSTDRATRAHIFPRPCPR